jgi:hypothetical protein
MEYCVQRQILVCKPTGSTARKKKCKDRPSTSSRLPSCTNEYQETNAASCETSSLENFLFPNPSPYVTFIGETRGNYDKKKNAIVAYGGQYFIQRGHGYEKFYMLNSENGNAMCVRPVNCQERWIRSISATAVQLPIKSTLTCV